MLKDKKLIENNILFKAIEKEKTRIKAENKAFANLPQQSQTLDFKEELPKKKTVYRVTYI